MSNSSNVMKEAATKDELHGLRSALERVTAEQVQQATILATVVSKIDILADAVNHMQRNMEQRSQGQWPTIFAGIAVVISIVLSVGGAALGPLYMSDNFTSDVLQRHIEEPGHSVAMQMHAGIAKDIERLDQADQTRNDRLARLDSQLAAESQSQRDANKALDAALQREMRDLDDVQRTRLDSLDQILQREMRMLNEITEAKTNTLKERIMALERSEYGQTIDQRDMIRD